MLGTGDVPCKAMIIGEAPGRNEDDTGEPFVGRAGELLRDLMAEVGIHPDDVYITNAVHCRPPDNRTPTKVEIRQCKAWLDYEIARVKPRVILLLGATPLMAVLGLKGIKKLRGQFIEQDGVVYLPAFHPAYVLRDERTRPMLRADLAKFKAMIEGGGLPVEPGLNYTIIHSRLDVEDMLDNLEASRDFTYDLETTGLYQWQGKIVSIGIATDDHQWVIPINHHEFSLDEDMVDDIVARIDKLNKPKSAHNAKFDALWMLVHFGVRWHAEFDTMLAHYLLDENARHGLDYIASERYGALDWDVPLPVKQGREGTLEKHARYLALDVMHTRRLVKDLRKDLDEQPGIAKVFDKLLMPAARLFVDIERRGVYVDYQKFDDVEKHLRDQMHQCELQLNEHVPNVNWRSPKQVASVLFDRLGLEILDKTKKGEASTSESVLKRLAVQHPVPRLLLKHREAKQQLSFFIDGWKPWLHKHRLHPSFKLHGTVTGRLSCENPNLQQVPRDPKIRQLLTAPPGWVFVEADLSQIELRILAELSRDPEMMRCFLTGIDIHWLTVMREIFRAHAYPEQVLETAQRISGRNHLEYDECYDILLKAGPDAAVDHGPKADGDKWPGWKEVRKRAKAINFGYAYGMWWKKFIVYARDNYDVDVTPEQAQLSRESYFELYAKLPKWHQKQRGFAHRHGYVRSLFGRKRRLPDAMSNEDTPERGSAERQAINSPVQSFASDLNLAAALELSEVHSREYMHIVGTVHDAILFEIRVDKLREVVNDILRVMSAPKLLEEFNITLTVPIEAEVKIGPWSLGVSPEKYFGKDKDKSVKPASVAPVPPRLPLQVRRAAVSKARASSAYLRKRRSQDD